jgi:hypothetical protein
MANRDRRTSAGGLTCTRIRRPAAPGRSLGGGPSWSDEGLISLSVAPGATVAFRLRPQSGAHRLFVGPTAKLRVDFGSGDHVAGPKGRPTRATCHSFLDLPRPDGSNRAYQHRWQARARMTRWGMPGPPRYGGAPVTNIRNLTACIGDDGSAGTTGVLPPVRRLHVRCP